MKLGEIFNAVKEWATASRPGNPSQEVRQKLEQEKKYRFDWPFDRNVSIAMTSARFGGYYMPIWDITAPSGERIDLYSDNELARIYRQDHDIAAAECKAERAGQSTPQNAPRP